MITREEMIQEAVYRMKLINIIPEVIRQFTESTRINMSEPPMAALYWANREDRKRIKDLEEENDILIYMGIRSHTPGKMDSFLYVSQFKEDWKTQKSLLKKGIVGAYVYNHSDPICSEFGDIGIKTVNGSLLRIW